MAADTPNKRLSAMDVGSPARGILPLPDGSTDGSDRVMLLGLYASVTSSAPAAGTGAEYHRRARALLAYELLYALQPELLEDDMYRLRR